MSVALPKLRVGDPLRHQALSVFPLFAPSRAKQIDYRLADEALREKTLRVTEVSEQGSVPELLVENDSDNLILFLEGEELIGAKQNRILNTSVLVGARSKLKIPVSCVEQGRWGYRSRDFGSSGSHSPSNLRRALKASVSKSVKERRGHRSDQGQVWREVACLQAAFSVESKTAAMADTFETHQDRIAAFRRNIGYPEGCCGVAVAIGKRIVSIDLFDKPSTCQKIWDRLLSGVVIDALQAGSAQEHAEVKDVEQLVGAVDDLQWHEAQAIGEGDEFRAESKRGDHASALVMEETIVHGSVASAV